MERIDAIFQWIKEQFRQYNVREFTFKTPETLIQNPGVKETAKTKSFKFSAVEQYVRHHNNIPIISRLDRAAGAADKCFHTQGVYKPTYKSIKARAEVLKEQVIRAKNVLSLESSNPALARGFEKLYDQDPYLADRVMSLSPVYDDILPVIRLALTLKQPVTNSEKAGDRLNELLTFIQEATAIAPNFINDLLKPWDTTIGDENPANFEKLTEAARTAISEDPSLRKSIRSATQQLLEPDRNEQGVNIAYSNLLAVAENSSIYWDHDSEESLLRQPASWYNLSRSDKTTEVREFREKLEPLLKSNSPFAATLSDNLLIQLIGKITSKIPNDTQDILLRFDRDGHFELQTRNRNDEIEITTIEIEE
jgi:hypothetical protein